MPPAAIATLTCLNAHHVQGLIVKGCGSTTSKFSQNSNLDVTPVWRTNMYARYSRRFDRGVRYSFWMVSQLLPQRRKLLRSISKVNIVYRGVGGATRGVDRYSFCSIEIIEMSAALSRWDAAPMRHSRRRMRLFYVYAQRNCSMLHLYVAPSRRTQLEIKCWSWVAGWETTGGPLEFSEQGQGAVREADGSTRR